MGALGEEFVRGLSLLTFRVGVLASMLLVVVLAEVVGVEGSESESPSWLNNGS